MVTPRRVRAINIKPQVSDELDRNCSQTARLVLFLFGSFLTLSADKVSTKLSAVLGK